MRAAAAKYAKRNDRFAFEAFLLHARVLRLFYLDKWEARSPWAESTVVAELYFPRPSDWRMVKGSKKVPTLGRTKEAIDKQLAHLTKERAEAFRDLQSDVPSLQAELDTLWEHFLTTLGKHRDVQPFRDALREKCRELGCP